MIYLFIVMFFSCSKSSVRLTIGVSLLFASYALFHSSSSFLPNDDGHEIISYLPIYPISEQSSNLANTTTTTTNETVSLWKRVVEAFSDANIDKRYGLFVFV